MVPILWIIDYEFVKIARENFVGMNGMSDQIFWVGNICIYDTYIVYIYVICNNRSNMRKEGTKNGKKKNRVRLEFGWAREERDYGGTKEIGLVG